MKSLTIKGLLVIVCSLPSLVAFCHPSLTGHVNQDNTIQWERDGSQNGDTAHNHHSNNTFNGRASTAEPFSVQSCWDNRTNRLDTNGNFDNGHCFIDEGTATNRVRYRFVGAWNVNAQARIREAFNIYSNVIGTGINNAGIAFVEAGGTAAEINIFWENQGGVNNGGFWRNADRELHFDNSMNWFFGLNPNEGLPGGIANNQWHFFTVMLHEVGHAVGFVHQLDGADVMNPPVGQPPNIAGHRYFIGLDGDTLNGVRSLYSQPEAGSVFSFESCHVTSDSAWNDYVTTATAIFDAPAGATFFWTWGDGHTSTNPPTTTHSYINSSNWDMYYSVTLTIISNGTSTTRSCGQVYVGGQG